MDEPKVDTQVAQSSAIRPQHRKLHDADVSFEEYFYYAQKTREEERNLDKPKTAWRQLLTSKKKASGAPDEPMALHQDHGELNLASRENRLQISDEEWTNASRAFRTASGGAAFYLVCPTRAQLSKHPGRVSDAYLRYTDADDAHRDFSDHDRHSRPLCCALRHRYSGLRPRCRPVYSLRPLGGLQRLSHLACLHECGFIRVPRPQLWRSRL